jgi:DNA-binding NarL/FixJ family response regulator
MAHDLAGKRILIVEDEYFIASDLARALEQAESVVVGPVGGLAQGVALARSEALDAAILDVNLEGAMSYAIADALRVRAIPFMFLTGYDDWALPEGYRHAPRVAKPCPTSVVMTCLHSMLAKEFAS